jgi:hypothetical protein
MRRLVLALLLCALTACAHSGASLAQQPPAPTTAAQADGQRDFDWETGEWNTHVRRLRSPLSPAANWVEYQGVSIVKPLLGGRSNVVELSVEGPAGRIEGMSLRLYNPQTRQWSLNYVNLASGELTAPVIGSFANGRGEFFGRDTLNGRPILVRFIISDVTPSSARFEQAFSADNGETWETNWIAVDTRRP